MNWDDYAKKFSGAKTPSASEPFRFASFQYALNQRCRIAILAGAPV
jgi:hypothetical protein